MAYLLTHHTTNTTIHRLWPLPWLLLASLLCSCTWTQPIDWPNYSYSERMQRLTGLSQWQWRGGLLLSDATQQHHRINTYWRYGGAHDYTLNFIAPLGVKSARLTVNQDGAQLQQSGQPTQTAASAEQLVAHYFGHGWPVQHLAYWVRGMPVPNQASKLTENQHHHIQTLTQDGWHITYHAYQLVDGYALPSALTISKDPFSLRIKIQTWQLPGQATKPLPQDNAAHKKSTPLTS